jgi:hypothetical protein
MTEGAKPYTMKVVRTVFNGGDEETGLVRPRLVATQLECGFFCRPFPAKAYAIENKRLILYGFRKPKVNRINNICILCHW